MELPEGTKIQILAPTVRGRKGEHVKVLDKARRSGYVRVRIDGNMYELEEEIKLDKNIKHNIEIVIDRLVVKPEIQRRLTDSIENALELTEGILMVDVIGGETMNFSQSFSCPDCGTSVEEIEPRSFSFNNPFGACPGCFGLGYKMEFDEELMIPDKSLSINQGAIVVMGWQSCNDGKSFSNAILKALCTQYDFDLDTPFEDYPQEVKDVLLYGTGGQEVMVYYKGQRGEGTYAVAFEGLIKNVERRYRETFSESSKQEYESFMRITPCKECKGMRLKRSSLAVTICDKNIYEITNLSIGNLQEFLNTMELSKRQQTIGQQVLKEIRARVGFLMDVGLDYLSLSRGTASLSGGEAQRIRLATQIGSGLVGVCYILDEPSIGLHQRDNDKLLATLQNLRDMGNTLIVVEHDEDTMFAADHIVDIGLSATTLCRLPIPLAFMLGTDYLSGSIKASDPLTGEEIAVFQEVSRYELFVLIVVSVLISMLAVLWLLIRNKNRWQGVGGESKRYCATVLCLAIVLLFTGCSDGDASNISFNAASTGSANEYEVICDHAEQAYYLKNNSTGVTLDLVRSPLFGVFSGEDSVKGYYMDYPDLYYTISETESHINRVGTYNSSFTKVSVVKLNLETFKEEIIFEKIADSGRSLLGIEYEVGDTWEFLQHHHSFFINENNIFFVGNGGITEVDRKSGIPQKLDLRASENIAFDGRYFYYIGNRSVLTKYDTQLGSTIPLAEVTAYDFCLDGQSIYYISMTDGYRVYQCSLDGESCKMVADIIALDVSCDETSIYIIHKGTGEQVAIEK